MRCGCCLGVTSGSTCNFTTLFRTFPVPPNRNLNFSFKTSGLFLFRAVTVAVFFGWVTRLYMSHCSRLCSGFWSANGSKMTNFPPSIARFPSRRTWVPLWSRSTANFTLPRYVVSLAEVLTIAWLRSRVTWLRGIFVSLMWATGMTAGFSFNCTDIWCGLLACCSLSSKQGSSKF